MPRPTIRIHDLSTDKVIDREMNDAEFAAHEAGQVTVAAQIAAEAAAVEAKASAIAKLSALGLTAEEIAALSK